MPPDPVPRCSKILGMVRANISMDYCEINELGQQVQRDIPVAGKCTSALEKSILVSDDIQAPVSSSLPSTISFRSLAIPSSTVMLPDVRSK